MSITLPLTPEATAELQRRAAAAGLDTSTFVLSAVQDKLAEEDVVPAESLSYDLTTSRAAISIVGSRAIRRATLISMTAATASTTDADSPR